MNTIFKRYLLASALTLAVCIAVAEAAVTIYTYKGPHPETHATLAANGFEQRNSGGNGWTGVTCGTAGTMLLGGAPAICSSSGVLSSSLTTPKLTSIATTTQVNADTGQRIAFTINDVGSMSVGGSDVNVQVPLSMSSNQISNLLQGTSSGQALAYPWISSTNGSVTLGSAFNITGASTVYQDTGLTWTAPTGTSFYSCDVRSQVNVSAGLGANIIYKLYNVTDSADVSNSIRIGAYAGVLNQTFIIENTISGLITVASAKQINLYAARETGTAYSTSAIASDVAGYTKCNYVKINDN